MFDGENYYWRHRQGSGEKHTEACTSASCQCGYRKADDEYSSWKECNKKEFHDDKNMTSPHHQTSFSEYTETDTTGTPMFSDIEQYISRQEFKDQYTKFSSPGTLSKKPIQCPHPKCNKYIGVLTFDSHFLYEHKEVPVIAAHLDSRTSLHFIPQHLQYGLKHCVCLLYIIGLTDSETEATLFEPEKQPSQDPCKVTPSFILLAAKVNSIQLSDDEEHNDLLDEQENASDFRPGDQAILWLASNIPTNHSYTVCLSTLSKDIRMKYYGPVLPLHGHPVDMCEHGKGLVLTHFHYFAMTENCTKPLSLDIVIHPED